MIFRLEDWIWAMKTFLISNFSLVSSMQMDPGLEASIVHISEVQQKSSD